MNVPARLSQVRIRQARQEDSAAVARLSGQLGYPATRQVIAARLEDALRDSSSIVVVAETHAGEIAGFAQFVNQRLIESDPRVEVAALVVDESARGRGVGRLLLSHGEHWARERGCNIVNVRSNAIRAAAHAFYEHVGYRHYKTQKAFRKDLDKSE
ncbi:MAG TPA: GNAT family N-acetyltransferase [Candidatus Limnocylindrales bacterium]|nr:GNAT family N-acetyltransferase [Candidatus Limnocylindrales bacterium]